MCGRLQPGYYQSCGWILFGTLMATSGLVYLIVTMAIAGREGLNDPKLSMVPVLIIVGALTIFMGCCLLCNTSQSTYFYWKEIKKKQRSHDRIVGSNNALKGQLLPIVSGYHPSGKWP